MYDDTYDMLDFQFEPTIKIRINPGRWRELKGKKNIKILQPMGQKIFNTTLCTRITYSSMFLLFLDFEKSKHRLIKMIVQVANISLFLRTKKSKW